MASHRARAGSSRLAKILRTIPGYDPFATAGDCWLDEAAAQTALDFFPECLRHVKGELAGKPLRLEDWQGAIVGNLFGWKRPDGLRRYREALVYVARKNGKTTLAGGLVNYVLFCDGEPGAEIYSAAAERDQAALVYEQAKGMVLQEPELSRRAHVYATNKSIVYGSSSYRAISAEANTKHGYNTHLVVIDELHAHQNRELVDVLITSTGSRRQPLVVHITTADYARESICNEKVDYARKVRDGIIRDSAFLPVINEASVDDDWKDPAVWRKANPNLGISIGEDYLRRECERAKASPRYENTFKRLHLNIVTEQAVRWLAMDAWDACADPTLSLSQFRNKPCYVGLDLSSKKDLTAGALLFPTDDGYALFITYWLPKGRLRPAGRLDKQPYADWAREGHIRATEGNVVDQDAIRKWVNEDVGKYFDVQAVGIDPWNAQKVATELAEQDGFNVVEVRQGYRSMSEPSKQFEAEMLASRLRHAGDPVTRWMASNVAVDTDPAGNIKPTKDPKKSTGRIDGITASVIAIACELANPAKKRSVYADRGLLFV